MRVFVRTYAKKNNNNKNYDYNRYYDVQITVSIFRLYFSRKIPIYEIEKKTQNINGVLAAKRSKMMSIKK